MESHGNLCALLDDNPSLCCLYNFAKYHPKVVLGPN